uniref:Uncharacterized protein n=1 Tax=Arundo donax TaxID=35708 RepID=A0A0A9A5M0_ARUDO
MAKDDTVDDENPRSHTGSHISNNKRGSVFTKFLVDDHHTSAFSFQTGNVITKVSHIQMPLQASISIAS